jgi:predicted ATP-grasp superfamily ATP-dependent carboligase
MDLVRALGLAGIRCAVVAPPGAPPRFSRFTRATLTWADAWEQPERLLDALLGFARRQRERPVLFYEEDRELLLVSRYRDVLAPAFRFVVPDATLVEDLVDKARFQRLAARHEIAVPRAQWLDPTARPPSLLGLDFPVVLKPLTRRTDRWDPVARGAKALRADNAAELAALWPRLASAGLPLLAQELVPGEESRIESYHAYVDRHGRVVGEFTGRKIRTWPPQHGDSTALEVTRAADVAALGRDVLARLQFRGVAKLDFKRDPTGRLWLLEINPRFNLWHHLGAVAGVNLPALVYGDLTGLPRPTASPRLARHGARWCKPWDDWRAARAAGIPLTRWLRWAMTCDAKRVVALNDPLPLVGATLWACFHAAAGAR